MCDLPQVDAEAAVLARTLETDPDAVRHADPLRTVCATVKTILHRQTDSQTDRQSDRHIYRQTDRQTHTNRQ